jgi:hypothetical protein
VTGRTAQIGRGTLLGLTLAALLGSLGLLVASFFARADCAGLSETECSFEGQVAQQQAARLRLSASGLGLVGAGGLFWLRTSSKEKRP